MPQVNEQVDGPSVMFMLTVQLLKKRLVSDTKRILLAEDDTVIAEVIRKYLAANNYSVSVAHTGTRALLMAVEEAPDALVCDWHLPEMDGGQILQLLKQQEATAKVPVIIITADLTVTVPGAFDVLRKPFHPQVLLEAVDKSLGTSGTGG